MKIIWLLEKKLVILIFESMYSQSQSSLVTSHNN